MDTITRTERLILIPLSAANTAEAHKVYSDTRIWEHRPNARYEDIQRTHQLMEDASHSWSEHGFGPWAAYLRHQPSEFVGVVGAIYVEGGNFWDIKYRLRPAHWAAGYATEATEATVKALHQLAGDAPITARVTTNHPAAIRVLEKVGLTPVWEGRRAGTADDPTEPDVRVYAESSLPTAVLEFIQQRP